VKSHKNISLMDILLKGLGLVLYIILSPLFALAEVIIAFTRYIIKEVVGKIRFVRSKTAKSFRSLSGATIKEEERVGTLNWF
jgi:hypothetical protein